MFHSIVRTTAALALAMFTFASSVHAQGDEGEFYKGKTISFLSGHSAGGGYDTYVRTLARHLGKHIPGNPQVIVKNVPGAGSLVLTNQVANTLDSDGTVIASVARGMAFEPLFGNEQALYKPGEMNWLGSLNNETSLCVAWHEAEVKTWQDLRSEALSVGSTGAGADTNLFPKVLNELFGFKFNIIAGYPGGNDVMLAMERGEVDGRCGWSWSSAKSTREEWIAELNEGMEQGKINILFQMSLKKHSDLPDVPLVTEFAETEKQRQVLNLLFARQVMGRPVVAPPGVPEARVAMLRKAVAMAAQDPEFLQDAKNQSLGINFVDGEEIQAIVVEAYEYPEDVIAVIKNAM
ncbi:MAG: tripartite tricarboxylate transporter substrate-binding protein [Marinobacter sp.]|uniref:Bug family tripartite tricarboxylate transporter substrate binding protein n=1 Tax=Marinobacter sp. TaxID=50741 RepID=UPI0034A00E92